MDQTTPRIIYLPSTALRRTDRLDKKQIQKYGSFDKLSLALFGAIQVDNNPQIFPTTENQHIQENIKHFDGTLNNFGSMVFAENQGQK